MMKKNLKYSSNPFTNGDEEDSSNDEDGEKKGKDEHTTQMEDGGFTMVNPETEGAKKGKGTDGVNTVQGIS